MPPRKLEKKDRDKEVAIGRKGDKVIVITKGNPLPKEVPLGDKDGGPSASRCSPISKT